MEVKLPEAGKIGAIISGVKGSDLTAEQSAQVLDLIYKHKLVVFKNQQDLTNEEYIQTARNIGTPQIYFQTNYHHPDHPEIFVSSNILHDGQKVGVKGTGRYWHTDCSFFEEPLSFTMVKPIQLPEATRGTYYIDMERMWEILPDDLRAAVKDVNCFQDAKWNYKAQPCDVDKSITEMLNEFSAMAPGAEHPAVIVHPVTKKEILYISQGFTTKVFGMSHEDSQVLLKKLFDFVCREEHIHTQTWQVGDILLWDNRSLVHKASTVPAGQPSESHRIGVYDAYPFYTNQLDRGKKATAEPVGV